MRKLVSELFEEGPRDVMVKTHECQARSNNSIRPPNRTRQQR